jgi:phosphoribosylglycinamide formyltransferase-1
LSRINIAVFASGNGTNAEEIFKYFHRHDSIEVVGTLTNNPKAKVIRRAANYHLPCYVFDRETFANEEKMLSILVNWNIDAVVLAGFLWLIPEYMIKRYPDRILNIHPALLPKFGGKGMYGMKVHQAVLDAGETESGITIHLVNQEYDQGKIILQEHCEVVPEDSAETLAQRIHNLEHQFYPRTIEHWLLQ